MRANTRPSPFSLIVRSYLADLRQWTGHLVAGYALACGFMLAGGVSLVIAIGIGVDAAFRALEMRYDIWIAYATIGGAFLVLGLLGLVMGRLLLGHPAPAVPRPSRQVDMLKRAIAVSAAARLIATSRPGGGSADTTTQALAAAAAAMLIGWFAASRFRRRHDDVQD
ncbi:hypothetical protein [Bradyrhizobium altum]|uniref:hypothetical protein n=1 Tax=Bradyrhizobium altum TaxID=1571202 RepID=UPI001E38F762|nr:hypothetical protein [Bradyrhizobium altum]